MPNCVVKGCRNHSAKDKKLDGITYHTFPDRDQEIKEKWIAAISQSRKELSWKPTSRSVVCSAHFKIEDFYYTKKGYRRVVTNGYPKILPNILEGLDNEDLSSTDLSNYSNLSQPSTSCAAAVKTVPRRKSSQSSDYAVPSSSTKGLRLDTATSSQPSNTVAKKRKFGEGNIPPLSSETFVMRLTKCVCCLERDAEELLWAERPHVGSYGDLIKELFGVQFPVPDNVATKTRICDQCKAELERTLQFRTSMLAAQSRLKLAFWPTPSPDTEDIDMVQSIKVEITEYEDNETAPEDINIEVTCKTEVDIEEHDVGAVSEATSSLVPRPAAKDAHTVQGTRKTTAKRREVSSKPSAGSSRTTQPADNSNARINYSELDETEVKVEPINVKLEPDPLAGDSVPLLFEHELSLGPWP